jgi:hypothetical protein
MNTSVPAAGLVSTAAQGTQNVLKSCDRASVTGNGQPVGTHTESDTLGKMPVKGA